MSYFEQPASWYWAHDIEAGHITSSLLLPGTQLVRLASYSSETGLRFASIVYYRSTTTRTFALDIEPTKVEETCRSLNAQAIGIDSYESLGGLYFALILEKRNIEPEPTNIHYDLTEFEVQHYLENGYQIIDFTIYRKSGGWRFAIITEKSNQPSWWFAGLSAKELNQALKKNRAKLVHIKGYRQGDTQCYAAVAVSNQSVNNKCIWYAGLTADSVARKLEKHKAYPVDLDPYKEQGILYFNVIMCVV